jgi:hypothetical protein
LSKKAQDWYYELSGTVVDQEKVKRDDPHLVQTVRELGKAANGSCADLRIYLIPSTYADCYTISEYDGAESIVLSPNNLIGHLVKSIDLTETSSDDCKKLLEKLQQIKLGDHPKPIYQKVE